jgi:HlyD family secretion protein
MRHRYDLGKPFPFPLSSPWAIILAIASFVLMSVGVIYFTYSKQGADRSTPSVTTSQPTTINALGYLEPQGGVIQVSAPSIIGGGYSRVAELLVKEGDRVQAGQVIAILDSSRRLHGALKEAQEQVQIAKSRLEQVKAGAKQGEIAAQQATVSRLEAQLNGEINSQQATITGLKAELQNARMEYQRNLRLYQDDVISASALDSKSLTLRTAQENLNEAKANFVRTMQTLKKQILEAKANLEQVAEVRPTDVTVVQAEVNGAMARVARTHAELELAYIRAPKAGRILKISTWPGEAVNTQGIVDLGQTDQMYVVAEVYETDITRVRLGQVATITSNAFSYQLRGSVDQIGWKIAKQDVFNNDPTAAVDARVVEVKIRLDKVASQLVPGLTNLQVDVKITP